ncbi:efflux RND transporter permease subunit [Dyella nitratireducens]|uniref:Acriflavine resistance protein B n=1 Tax=Dyella nitratireducens TaxID=1849580 RepID=A0ABQ1FT14_9GAMM|nr:efflux RND transporter permease subunit [Dyella nitratireducens]GGA29868.1 acriflavine resistance protein B [Dyella nitratireducens]GLQ43085.1 acriflavine resistance protein B [Dyella nitratireducens]
MRSFHISAIFIERPVATSLLMLGIVFLGMASYMALPIAGVPQVDIPTISISTYLPGASAETMATAVTAPLERALVNMPGVTEMTSTSSLGSSSIDVQFDLSRSIDGAALDVQSAINAAAGDLPKTLPHPPTFEKANPADALLMSVAVYSDQMPIDKVDDYVENYLAPEMARIQGVGVVDFHGQQKPAVRVRVNPGVIASLGISLEDIRAAIANATSNSPKGTLNGVRQAVTLDATDQVVDAATYSHLIVAYRNGAPVHLRDIANVVASVEDVRQGAWYDGRQVIIVDVHKQIGFNIDETVDRIKAELPRLSHDLPATIHVTVLGDRTQTIRASVIDLQFTLLLSIALVVAVVYAFLRDARATLIPAITIPISILGTFAVMALLDYSLDNVSLMALTVVIGFVVDDAIVMLENILRHIEEGQDPRTAALSGSGEIAFTILSMTFSLVAVFIPLLFMGGVVGRLFREFSVTAGVAILISGAVSLSLTPTLCALLLNRQTAHGRGRFHQAAEAFFNAVQNVYAKGLRRALRHPNVMLAVAAATLAGTIIMYVVIPKGFFPQQDNGLIAGVTEASQDISYPAMVERMHALAEVVEQDPAIEHVYYWVEGDPSINIGRMSIDLKPFGERKASVYDVINRLRPRVAQVPGISLSLQARQDLQIGARVSKSQFQYTLRDTNVDELHQWAPVMLKALREIPVIQDVEADLEPVAPRLTLVFDRDTMSRLGITSQLVDDTLNDAFGQRQVASYYTQLNEYRVVLEVDPTYQLDENALSQIYLTGNDGKQVPLSTFITLKHGVAPLTVNHDGQFPAVTLSFNLASGHSLSEAVEAIEAKGTEVGQPPGLTATFQGSAKAFKTSLATQPMLIAAAILAIYIILGMLYESYIHPLTILSTLPSAGIGALGALMLLHDEFSLIALIGVILLIGIVKKNGIMMVDFAISAEKERGLAPVDAIYEASLLRFRPIMMTTLAALLGALPLAFGSGAGAELRRPLGITIVGGLLISQLLTLYTTPIIYLFLDRARNYLAQRRAKVLVSADTADS